MIKTVICRPAGRNIKIPGTIFARAARNKGALCTGWKTISGKRYFLAKKTGARVTGWHTIKNTLYYFNNKGVLQKGKTVGEYQLDKITGAAIKIATEPDTSEVTDESNTTGGDADNTATTVDKLHIFVGDSRTVGLSNAMGCVSYDKLLQIRTEENLTEYYLAGSRQWLFLVQHKSTSEAGENAQ